MKRGARVRVVRGRKSQGVEGTVFWEGPNKYGEGTRLGIKDAEGESHWVNTEYVELLEEPDESGEAAPKPTGPAPDESKLTKGALVRWGDSEGTIFWVGQNKFGPGLRLGVTGADEQKHWVDAAEVQLLEEAEQGGGGGPPEDDGAFNRDDEDDGRHDMDDMDDADDAEVPF